MASIKPGRNEPCPCGSGNKYKRCCGSEPVAKPTQAPLNSNEIGRLVALVEQGRLGEAERSARSLIATHPNAGILWKILSVALLRQGKEALQALQRTAQLMPQDAEALSNLGSALHDRGSWDEALVNLRRALAIQPNDIQALIEAGNALKALRRVEEAVPLYRRALELDPREPQAQNNLGNAFLELRRFDDAIACYRGALVSKPDDCQVHANLANAFRHCGLPEEAVSSCRRALALDPNLAFAHNVLGLTLAALGRREEAAASFQRALTRNANDVEVLTNLGNVLRDLGRIGEAVAVYVRAVDCEPRQAAAHVNLGNALINLQRFDEAVASHRRALALQPDLQLAHLSLATALRLQGRASEAEAGCEAALSLDPNYVDALFLLGELRADRGHFGEAQELFRRAVSINPDFPNAWYAMAAHRKMGSEDNEWQQAVQRLLATPLPLRHEIGLRHALGKYHDDLELYEAAFGHYRQANELTKRYGKTYDGAGLAKRVDEIIAHFDSGFMRRSQPAASASKRPVFVIGMPRSGTSLIEQILASHPAVFGAGELTFWDSAFTRYEAAGLKGHSGANLIAAMAKAYLDELELFSGDAQRVVDKMPANFMNVGLIHAAFPQARFVHVQRNPIDTCLSIYFQQFTFLHPYANDLENLAHYYGLYRRITDHWRSVLPPGLWLEIPYEGLIDNQEAWTRRLLEFVGLPWDPKCLDFHQTERVVITLSKWQVRQKLHAASAGRWKHYEKFVGPLQSLVNPAASH